MRIKASGVVLPTLTFRNLHSLQPCLYLREKLDEMGDFALAQTVTWYGFFETASCEVGQPSCVSRSDWTLLTRELFVYFRLFSVRSKISQRKQPIWVTIVGGWLKVDGGGNAIEVRMGQSLRRKMVPALRDTGTRATRRVVLLAFFRSLDHRWSSVR